MNPCIHIISSRSKCLSLCLESLYDCYNYKHNYPVYVHYFDDIYDDKSYREKIYTTISKDIKFINVPYSTPRHIQDSELFYNRRDIQYVNTSFPITRKGYLHMCHFMCNFYRYKNTKLHSHDMAMSLDDESLFIKKMDSDPFQIMADRSESIGALICGQRLKNGTPHQGHRDTRIGLWEFTKKFIQDNNITPEFPGLTDILLSDHGPRKIHYLPWADSYIIKLDIFKTQLWNDWRSAFNENGGIYKYRWGDNELISLFGMLIQKSGILNLKIVEDGYHDQGGLRHIQDYAPNIKNLEV
jgi:hypothetical protein